MKIKESLQRLTWRFSQGNAFKPNRNDINALNEIVEFIGQKEQKQLLDNQLFGKLYIYLFGEFVVHYEATVMDSIPQTELNRILDKDLRLLVEEVKDRLNNAELESCIKEGRHKDFKPMEYDEVATNLRIMVNAAINTFGPKHLEKVNT